MSGNANQPSPFDACDEYRRNGWTNTIRLSPSQKFPPPSGYTGAEGRTVLKEDVESFRALGRGNIALRLPKLVVGLDADQYGEKQGLDELNALERELGRLPKTWWTSSRPDGGILYFRLRPGWDESLLPGNATKSTEIIRYSHRYAMVPPSVHPDGDEYVCYGPDGREDTLPAPGFLPELPEAWWEFLTAKKAPALPETKLGVGGDKDAALSRIKEHAKALAALPDGPGSDACFQAGRMIGELAAGAGLSLDVVRPIALAALEGWTFTGKGKEVMAGQVENGLRKGLERPVVWEAQSTAKLFDDEVDASVAVAGSDDASDKPDGIVFTDAALSEHIADVLLRGRFVRTRALGWLKWTGKYWKQCDDGAATEAVRRYVQKQLFAAIRKGSSSQKLWDRYNAAGKIASLVSLAGNQDGILRDAGDFDQHADLINTPDGVLDLRTLELSEHDPALLLTKITNANYKPGFTSADVDQLLQCVPADALPWLQRHLGAGVSGRPKPRVPAVLLTGEGRNGKTLLMETVLQALGGIDGTGYAVQVPNELLLAGKVTGGPSPEKLILRGARFAYIEETPEGRFLDVNAAKGLIGTGVTKARDLYKGLVSFRLTHVLFINTNHPPRVTETDTATWDRLTSLKFPLRYRKEHDGLGPWLENDRPGSTGLGEDLQSPKNLDALFTFMVDGFLAGRTDQVEVPASVASSVAAWRKEGDSLLRFLDDVFEFDAESWVTTADLYVALRKWSEFQGQQKPPPMNTFLSRIKAHTGLSKTVTVRRIVSGTAGLSRPASTGWLIEDGKTLQPLGRQSMAAFGLKFRGTEN